MSDEKGARRTQEQDHRGQAGENSCIEITMGRLTYVLGLCHVPSLENNIASLTSPNLLEMGCKDTGSDGKITTSLLSCVDLQFPSTLALPFITPPLWSSPSLLLSAPPSLLLSCPPPHHSSSLVPPPSLLHSGLPITPPL